MGQCVVRKVHTRMSRLERSTTDNAAGLAALRRELHDLNSALARSKEALLSAQNEENELVVRFVEAKLRCERLTDQAADVRDAMTQLRRDSFALDADLQIKVAKRDELAAARRQKELELAQLESLLAHCERRTRETDEQFRRRIRELHRTRVAVHNEHAELTSMEERLASIRDTVTTALTSAAHSH